MHTFIIHKNKVQHVTYCSEYAKGKAMLNAIPHRIDVDEVMENITPVLQERKIAQYSLENKTGLKNLAEDKVCIKSRPKKSQEEPACKSRPNGAR